MGNIGELQKNKMSWTINKTTKNIAKNPILIEGLPGVGNVGKIAVEYLIDALNAKKLYEMRSNEMPHYVFVNESNLIELPSIEIYSAKIKGRNILLLSGDVQPTTENSCHSFCNTLIEAFEKTKGKEIITLGGIALQEVPDDPSMYFTANNKDMLKKYAHGRKTEKQLHEFIGPIVGVTGLLPGLAGRKRIPAITMLVETFENPGYIGLNEARKVVKHLNKKLNLNLNEKKIDKELEAEVVIPQEGKVKIKKSKKKQEAKSKPKQVEEVPNYMYHIG